MTDRETQMLDTAIELQELDEEITEIGPRVAYAPEVEEFLTKVLGDYYEYERRDGDDYFHTTVYGSATEVVFFRDADAKLLRVELAGYKLRSGRRPGLFHFRIIRGAVRTVWNDAYRTDRNTPLFRQMRFAIKAQLDLENGVPQPVFKFGDRVVVTKRFCTRQDEAFKGSTGTVTGLNRDGGVMVDHDPETGKLGVYAGYGCWNPSDLELI